MYPCKLFYFKRNENLQLHWKAQTGFTHSFPFLAIVAWVISVSLHEHQMHIKHLKRSGGLREEKIKNFLMFSHLQYYLHTCDQTSLMIGQWPMYVFVGNFWTVCSGQSPPPAPSIINTSISILMMVWNGKVWEAASSHSFHKAFLCTGDGSMSLHPPPLERLPCVCFCLNWIMSPLGEKSCLILCFIEYFHFCSAI